MQHRHMPITVLTVILVLTTLHVGHVLANWWAGPLYWVGQTDFVTARFHASGTWDVTLDAWCFEGGGFVSVLVYDAAGHEVGDVAVLGEGSERVTFETEPGEYVLHIDVSDPSTYTWQLEVAPIEGQGVVARL